MAWATRNAADLIFSMRDASGSPGQMRVHVPYATLASVAIAAADTLRPLIEAMTGCTIYNQSLVYASFDDAPAAPQAGSRVEDKAVFIYRLANGLTTRQEIPGIDPSLVNVSGTIKTSAASVLALTTAVTAVDAIFCGVDGSDIRSLLSAQQRFRKTTKSSQPSGRLEP